MGMIKSLDIPPKEKGQVMDREDRAYMIKLVVITAFFTIALTLLGVQLMLEKHISRMGDSAKALKEWSKKADLANEILGDMFKVHHTKEAYKKQGIGAEEAHDINIKQEDNNETNY